MSVQRAQHYNVSVGFLQNYSFSSTKLQQNKTPMKNVAFVKTHKTGGSSIQNVLLRYAEKHNLNVVIPASGNYIGHPQPFNKRLIRPLQVDYQYNILAHHARFHYQEMKNFMPPHTVFVTILRDPIHLFESLYSYYDLEHYFNMTLDEYVRVNQSDLEHHNRRDHGRIGRNQMSFDLGLQIEMFEEQETEILKFADILNQQFDLIMIADMMNESLVLFKHLVGWTTEDIITFKHNFRQEKFRIPLNSTLKRNIIKWNKADAIIYNYFYQKFLQKIDEYGKEKLKQEVNAISEAIQSWYNFCIAKEIDRSQMTSGYRAFSDQVYNFELKNTRNLTCQKLTLPELYFTMEFKYKQERRLATGITTQENA